MLLIPFLLTACAGPYSALDPAGPSAAMAAWLWWGMFGWFTMVFIAVVALWVYAMIRKPARPVSAAEARHVLNRWVIGGGILLPVISITVILFFGIPLGHKMITLSAGNEGALRIEVTGRRWQWDVRYPGTDIALVDELHMPAGMPVDIYLSTDDVIHSFWVPRLGRKLDMIPGRVNILRLKSDRPGIYRGQCAEFCGIGHAHMQFTVIAHSPEDFARWLEERRRDE